MPTDSGRRKLKDRNLRVMVITWNQGGKDVKGFKNLEQIIPNIADYDLIAIAS